MAVSKVKEMKCLKNLLIRCCYWYYVKAQPIISDREYDQEFNRLKKLEAQTFADTNSPTQMIWGDQESQYPEWVKENMGKDDEQAEEISHSE